ncbi:Plant organelle RNA recognition domain, partial [Musa troglodytarum]
MTKSTDPGQKQEEAAVGHNGGFEEGAEQVIPLKRLEHKPHKVEDFIRKLPKLFEIYRDKKEQAEELVEEEARLLEEHSEKA